MPLRLIAYWLGELDAEQESGLEEHLFSCAECSARLNRLVQLGDGIKRELRRGNLSAILSVPFIRRLQAAGVRVREYRLQPGGSVLCTVTPEDDLVVAHLHVPLQNVRRLDVVFYDVPAGTRTRAEDIAFDPAGDEVVLAPNATELRRLGFATQRVELIAVEDDAEHVVAEYTFNHSPHWARRDES
jgi:hypothetical protein